MKGVYPVILRPANNNYFVVDIPDFNINTQGEGVADAIFMARDAIGLMGIDMEDDNKILPKASSISDIQKNANDCIVTLIDVDFDEYRRKHEMRAVKKNCTIPSWLNEKALEAGINFSSILQEALKRELNIID